MIFRCTLLVVQGEMCCAAELFIGGQSNKSEQTF